MKNLSLKDFNDLINTLITTTKNRKKIVNEVIKNFVVNYEEKYNRNVDNFSKFVEYLTATERKNLNKFFKDSTNIQLILNPKKGGCKFVVAYLKGVCKLTLNDGVNVDDIDIYNIDDDDNDDDNKQFFKNVESCKKSITNLFERLKTFKDSNDYDESILFIKEIVDNLTTDTPTTTATAKKS